MDEPHILVNTLYKDKQPRVENPRFSSKRKFTALLPPRLAGFSQSLNKKSKRKSFWFKNICNHFDNLSSQNYLLILLITLTTILVVVTHYLMTEKYKRQNQAYITPIPTPTLDPTANWKTYRNDKFRFEFKYPTNWKSENYLEDSMVAVDPVKLITEKELLNQNIPPGIISIHVNLENPNNETYCWKDLPHYTILSSKSLGFQNNIPIKFIENDNIIDDPSQFYKNKYRLDYYFCSKDGTNVHAILVINQNEKNIYLTLFDQILSTFQFIDQECPEGQELKECKLGPCCCPMGALCD